MQITKSEEEIKEKVGENLKVFRTIKHFTQRDMGEHLGCSSGVYSSYESGRRALQYPMLFRFWEIGGNLNWLFSNTGEVMRDKKQSERSLYDKAALEAQEVQTGLMYASSRKPEKEALLRAYSQVYNNLILFYSDSEEYSRFEMVEKHNLALKPLRDLF